MSQYQTDYRPRVLAALACSLAWLLTLLLFGLSVTDEAGKTAVCIALLLVSWAGSLLAVLAYLKRDDYARLALGVNLTLGMFSVLAAVAALS